MQFDSILKVQVPRIESLVANEANVLEALKIIALCILCCVIYGIVHDQITARICVEYFTIGHPPMFPTSDPTLLGLGWGIIATWWVGVILGIPLAFFSRVGSLPKITARQLVRPLIVLMACSACFAVLAGLIGYVAASNGWVFLIGSMAKRVPAEKHVAFLVDLWAHNASYISGFIGGVILMGLIWRWRLMADVNNRES